MAALRFGVQVPVEPSRPLPADTSPPWTRTYGLPTIRTQTPVPSAEPPGVAGLTYKERQMVRFKSPATTAEVSVTSVLLPALNVLGQPCAGWTKPPLEVLLAGVAGVALPAMEFP